MVRDKICGSDFGRRQNSFVPGAKQFCLFCPAAIIIWSRTVEMGMIGGPCSRPKPSTAAFPHNSPPAASSDSAVSFGLTCSNTTPRQADGMPAQHSKHAQLCRQALHSRAGNRSKAGQHSNGNGCC